MKKRKKASLRFKRLDEDMIGGIFVPPDKEAWCDLNDELDDIEDLVEYQGEYFYKLLRMIEKQPLFLDAYVNIGAEFFNNGYVKEAEKYYRMGLDIALPLIPESFKGTIPWLMMDNRAFLRLHYGYAHCQFEKGRVKEAIELLEQHLGWNPDDNIGARFLLKEACLQVGVTHFRYNDLKMEA